MVDDALKGMSGRFNEIYGEDGRSSVAPERRLQALLPQMLYSMRSEWVLTGAACLQPCIDGFLYRWFVGLSESEPVRPPTVFTKILTGCWKAR
jgi:hypothetical protein